MKFCPLRKLKSGKIAVAAYSTWRPIRPFKRTNLVLTIDVRYREYSPSELVYNYKGENLFFNDFNPYKIPIYEAYAIKLPHTSDIPTPYAIRWYRGGELNFNCRGLDCDGVPLFSHFTAEQIANGNNLSSMNNFEPLTVETVVKFWGWFLEQAEAKELIVV